MAHLPITVVPPCSFWPLQANWRIQIPFPHKPSKTYENRFGNDFWMTWSLYFLIHMKVVFTSPGIFRCSMDINSLPSFNSGYMLFVDIIFLICFYYLNVFSFCPTPPPSPWAYKLATWMLNSLLKQGSEWLSPSSEGNSWRTLLISQWFYEVQLRNYWYYF